MRHRPFYTALCSLLLCAFAFPSESLATKPENESLKNEVRLSIDRSLAWLKEQQKPEGWWSKQEHPAITGLVLMAFQREPSGKYLQKNEMMENGYAYLRSNAKPDGGIYQSGLANYNTSVSMMALLASPVDEDEQIAAKARNYIVQNQARGMEKPETDGGIGYGTTGVSPKRGHPDLDNTLVALEALEAFRSAHPNIEFETDLNWDAAVDFIQRCQNLPSENPRASTDPANRGGFVYYPGFSNADPADDGTKPRPLRSYGTMTYAGLLSFIYADMRKDSAPVQAALDWLKKNYSLEENPGMGARGLYYYYHLMAKGLAVSGTEYFETSDGKKVEWARALGEKLISLQKGDGHWVNTEGRWMETDPVLVTAYCTLALEIIHNKL